MTEIRRLDHIALIVSDTTEALAYYCDRLGLRVESSEELTEPAVRLTYLDAGSILIQLIEPLSDSGMLAQVLAERGEGFHHLCFSVDDVAAVAAALADQTGATPALGKGRGRTSAFIPGPPHHGTLVELNQFRRTEDIDERPGLLEG